MELRLDTYFAQKYGEKEALLLGNIIYWIKQYRTLPAAQKDGKTFMYHSVKALQSSVFTWWSIRTIERVIQSLRDQNLIYTELMEKNKGLRFFLVDEDLFLDVKPIKEKCPNCTGSVDNSSTNIKQENQGSVKMAEQFRQNDVPLEAHTNILNINNKNNSPIPKSDVFLSVDKVGKELVMGESDVSSSSLSQVIDQSDTSIGINKLSSFNKQDKCPILQSDCLFSDQNERPCVLSDWFDTWWQMVVNKEGKKKSKKAFFKIAADKDNAWFDGFLAAYKKYTELCQRSYRHFKLPLTWLNGECWEDDLHALQREAEADEKRHSELEEKNKRTGARYFADRCGCGNGVTHLVSWKVNEYKTGRKSVCSICAKEEQKAGRFVQSAR